LNWLGTVKQKQSEFINQEAIMKKYYKTKNEANKARAQLIANDPYRYGGYHVWRMKKGSRKAGWFAVCTEIEYLNTY
jgi:hypothetical protein